MPRKSIKLNAFHLPILLLVATIFGLSVYTGNKMMNKSQQGDTLGSKSTKKDNSKKPDKTNQSEKGNKDKAKPEKEATSNSKQYKEKITKVVDTLNGIAEEEKELGNEETGDDLKDVAEAEEEEVNDVTDAINEVESKPKWQTFLFGTDYKNLGQLRSSLAKNTNSIRKLTKTAGEVTENQEQVQEQLQTLEQERERIRNVIQEEENKFSLLGWVFRFLNGYPAESIDETDVDVDGSEEVITDGTGDSNDSDGTGDTSDNTLELEPATDDTGTTIDTNGTGL